MQLHELNYQCRLQRGTGRDKEEDLLLEATKQYSWGFRHLYIFNDGFVVPFRSSYGYIIWIVDENTAFLPRTFKKNQSINISRKFIRSCSDLGMWLDKKMHRLQRKNLQALMQQILAARENTDG